MKFLNILLKEGRKEELKKKYADKFDEEDLDFILGISDLQDFNHKYTDWVLKNILAYDDVDMMAEVAVELVKDFDKYQKNLEKKDINQYLSFEELDKALLPSKLKEKERELESQTEKIYEDENFLVLIPKTIEASCKYGSGTKWCVTQKGAGHFERYTSGKQGLYFIIRKKGNQTEPHYKVAVHINNIGNESWWDARDTRMNNEAVTLFKSYFPELYNEIVIDSKEKRRVGTDELSKIFSPKDHSFEIFENFHKVPNKDLTISITGYDLISDMPGRAVGDLKILLNDELLDEYNVFITFEPKSDNRWSASVGFSEEFETEPKFDFKFWQGWGFDVTQSFNPDPQNLRLYFDSHLIGMVRNKIYQNQDFEKFLKNVTGPTWRPDRIGYGYTFGKNKGLIKKLVDYLDKRNVNGTKLDFLESIGKLKSRVVNGKKEYAHSYSDKFFPSSQFRGHFASFFASAKHAGIIQYRKDGSKFIIEPGPNFQAFKEGKLKAL